jgi:16S rRNA (guanine(527)-N(7))-methyltransferase RsmG
MPTPTEQFAAALELHAPDFRVALAADDIAKLQGYYALLLKWNSRLHLVAPGRSEEFATRHVLESLLLLKHLPLNATVADIGSGAGLPIIPCLTVREDLRAMLFEASQKKCVFLKEAVRLVQSSGRATVMNSRFETVGTPDVQFVTCRALDKFEELLPVMIEWAPRDATFLFFVGERLKDRIEVLLTETEVKKIPQSDQRFLVIGRNRLKTSASS